MLHKIKLVLAAVAISFGGSASAATYDFISLIEGGGVDGDGGTNDTTGESTWGGSSVSGGWTVDGITLNAWSNEGDAYLDSNTAGLGVCGSWDDDYQCDPTSDDNVQVDEVLYLYFSEVVLLTDLILRQADHSLFEDGQSIMVSNGYVTDAFVVGFSNLLDWGSSAKWSFWTDAKDGNREFYISSVSVVPVPAAGLLLLTALGGTMALRRRKTK